jgi:hypothetical protein
VFADGTGERIQKITMNTRVYGQMCERKRTDLREVKWSMDVKADWRDGKESNVRVSKTV